MSAYTVGDRLKTPINITEKMVEQFAEMSGDYNPVHMNEEYAKKTRFGKRIAHGMISAALISRVLAMELGNGGIYLAQDLKFLVPIYLNETVTVELFVISFRRGIAHVETIVRNEAGEIAVKGEATIMAPKAVETT
jgi:3-hydroxybutyryl-CoA dehydratase